MNKLLGSLLLHSLLLLLLTTPPVVAKTGAPTQDDKQPKLTAEEIVAKHLQAAGGREKLARYKTRVALGSVRKENEAEGRLAIVSDASGRTAAVFVFRNLDLRFVSDGERGAVRPQLPRQLASFDAKYREMTASGLFFNGVSLHNLLLAPPADAKFEARGLKKVRGRDAHLVEVKRPKADAMRLYFDAETFMWVRTDYGKAHVSREMREFSNAAVNHGGDEMTVNFYVETSDFKNVGGVMLPFKFEMMITTPFLRQSASAALVGTITEYRHNEPIDPDMFR